MSRWRRWCGWWRWGSPFVAATIALFTGRYSVFGFGLAWGVAIAVVAIAQLMLALLLEHRYDPLSLRAFLLGPFYPLAYWVLNAIAALRCQVSALVRGPREQRVVWDVRREALEPAPDDAAAAE